jgi:two-component system chemotaxis response regulator CheY
MNKILIADDDQSSLKILNKIFSRYGTCTLVVDGAAAVASYKESHEQNSPFNLLCLDILMPKVNGDEVLQQIREHEKALGIPAQDFARIIMTTSIDDAETVVKAFYQGCESYITKPFDKAIIHEELCKMGFVSDVQS